MTVLVLYICCIIFGLLCSIEIEQAGVTLKALLLLFAGIANLLSATLFLSNRKAP